MAEINKSIVWFWMWIAEWTGSAGDLFELVKRPCQMSGGKVILLHRPWIYDRNSPAAVAPGAPFHGDLSKLTAFVRQCQWAGIQVGAHLMTADLRNPGLIDLLVAAGFDWFYFDGYEREPATEAAALVERLFAARGGPPARIQGSQSSVPGATVALCGEYGDDLLLTTDPRTMLAYRAAHRPVGRETDYGWWSERLPGSNSLIERRWHPLHYEQVALACHAAECGATIQRWPDLPLICENDVLYQFRRLAALRRTRGIPALEPGAWGWMLPPRQTEPICVYECPYAVSNGPVQAFVAERGSGSILTLWPTAGEVKIELKSRLAGMVTRVLSPAGADLTGTLLKDGVLRLPAERRLWLESTAYMRNASIGLRSSTTEAI